MSKRVSKVSRREKWVNDLFLGRQGYGQYHQLIPRLLNNDRFGLKKFLRIDQPTFMFLANKLRPSLQKFSPFRTPLSTEEKLAVTLRFLASGDSYQSLQFGFLIAANNLQSHTGNVRCNYPNVWPRIHENANHFRTMDPNCARF